jgi:glycosyltransferase involved in cell wall biosynthesis
LPSWYELPGIVNIEAARHGTNIVVTDYGTIRDYVGEDAFYCVPDDAESIERAVVSAYNAPRNAALQRRVQQFTWKNSAKRNLEIYTMALERYGYARESLPAPSAARAAIPRSCRPRL